MQLGAARPVVVAAWCSPPVRVLCTLLTDFPSAGVHLSPFWGLGGYNSTNIDWNASVYSPVEGRPWLSTSQVSLHSAEHRHRRKVELSLAASLIKLSAAKGCRDLFSDGQSFGKRNRKNVSGEGD